MDRKFRKLKYFFLIFVLIGTIGVKHPLISSSSGIPIQTELNVYYLSSTTGEVIFYTDDVLIFYVEVFEFASNVSVTTGTVTAVDTSDSSFNVQADILPDYQNVSFQKSITAYDNGLHVFQFSYTDATSTYEDCSASICVFFNYDPSGEVSSTIIDITSKPSSTFRGEPVNVTGLLTLEQTSFPYFYLDEDDYLFYISMEHGGKRYVLSTSFANASGPVTGYKSNLTIISPLFFDLRIYTFTMGFTGCYSSDLEATTTLFNVTIVNPFFDLHLSLINNKTERMGFSDTAVTPLTIECEVINFQTDLTARFELYSSTGTFQAVVLDAYTVTSRSFTVDLTFRVSELGLVSLGEHVIKCILQTAGDVEISHSNSSFILVDDVIIEDVLYTDSIAPSTAMDVQFATRIEDNHAPVVSNYIVTTGNETIEGITDSNGLVSTTIQSPGIPGFYDLEINATPDSSSYLVNASIKKPITVVSDSYIINSLQMDTFARGEQVLFSANVVGDQGTVTTGDLSLFHQINVGTLSFMHTSRAPLAEFYWTVSSDFPTGYQVFKWIYANGTLHNDSSYSFTLKILSKPKITGFSANNDSVKIGESLIISGKLVDESNQAVNNVNITIKHSSKSTDTVDEWVVTTNATGFFSTVFNATNTTELGLHTLKAQFLPVDSVDNYYLESSTVELSFEVWTDLVLIISPAVIAGEPTSIVIRGNDGQIVKLNYVYQGSSFPVSSNIQLDGLGTYSVTWIVPDNLQGKIYLVVEDVFDQNFHYSCSIDVLIRPCLNITAPADVLTNQPFIYKINASHPFNISVDGNIIYFNLFAGEDFQRFYTFSEPGHHIIEVSIEGNWVVHTSARINISAYLELYLDVAFPFESLEGETEVIVTVTDIELNLVSGAIVTLHRVKALNETELLMVKSSPTGVVNFSILLDRGLHSFLLEVQVPSGFYFPVTYIFNITALSVPQFSFTGPSVFGEQLPYDFNILVTAGEHPVKDVAVEFKGIDMSGSVIFKNINYTDSNGISTYSHVKLLDHGSYLLVLSVNKSVSECIFQQIDTLSFKIVAGTAPKIITSNYDNFEGTSRIRVNVTHSNPLISVDVYISRINSPTVDIIPLPVISSGNNWSYCEGDLSLSAGKYSVYINATDNTGLFCLTTTDIWTIENEESNTSNSTVENTGVSSTNTITDNTHGISVPFSDMFSNIPEWMYVVIVGVLSASGYGIIYLRKKIKEFKKY